MSWTKGVKPVVSRVSRRLRQEGNKKLHNYKTEIFFIFQFCDIFSSICLPPGKTNEVKLDRVCRLFSLQVHHIPLRERVPVLRVARLLQGEEDLSSLD